VQLVDTQRRVHVRGGQKKVDFYLRLLALGTFPDDAPHTIRRVRTRGRTADRRRKPSQRQLRPGRTRMAFDAAEFPALLPRVTWKCRQPVHQLGDAAAAST